MPLYHCYKRLANVC